MANEISMRASLKATKGTLIIPEYGGTKTIDMAGSGGGGPGMVAVSNAANGTTITPIAGVTNLGLAFIKNVDAAAILTYGPVVAGTLHEMGEVQAGEFYVLRLKAGITFALKSDINNSKAQVVVMDK